MTHCPVCLVSLDYHIDAACIEAERRRAEVAKTILRNVLLATPYREFATAGMATMAVIVMSYGQYETLKKFAEEG